MTDSTLADLRLPPMRLGKNQSKPPAPPQQTTKPQGDKKRATLGRFKMLNAFVDSTLCTLEPSAAAVWLVLFRCARNGFAKCSHTLIAKRTGLSTKTVSRAVTALTERGLVERISGGIPGKISQYRIRGVAAKAKHQPDMDTDDLKSVDTDDHLFN